MTTNKSNGDGWPQRPAAWPDIMTDTELAQYLGIDDGRTPEQARRTLRHIRRTQGGPADIGRLAGRTRFRKATVDAWLEVRERSKGWNDHRTNSPKLASKTVEKQGAECVGVSEVSELSARRD